jgi:uncharacterized delta-60 repeat protein
MVRALQIVLEPLEAREVPAVGLDPTFGTNGYVLDPAGTHGLFQSVVGAVAAPGGHVIVVGNTPASGPSTSGTVALTRLSATGAIDQTFGAAGVDTLNFPVPHTVTTVVEQADGKILLGGTFTNATGTDVSPDVFALRLNADGTRDATFGTGGETDFTFNPSGTLIQPATDALDQLAVAQDGSIVFAGTVVRPAQGEIPPGGQLILGRLHANGTPDTSFGFGPPGIIHGEVGFPFTFGGMAIQPDGSIVVAGSGARGPEGVPPPNSINFLAVDRFSSNGIRDSSFGGTLPQSVPDREETASSVAVLSDGRIVVGGSTRFGEGVLDWFDSTGKFLGEDQSGDTVSSGGLKQIDEVLAAPTGGAEVIGTDVSGGLDIERHTGPGAAAVDRVVVNPGAFAAPTALLYSPDGSALVVGHTGVDGYASDTAPSISLTRFTDPGTTTSTATSIQPERTTQPAGRISLVARVLPLLGSGPVTGGTVTFREGATVLGTMPADSFIAAPSPVLPPGDHTITVDFSGTAQWAASSTTYTLHLTPNHTVTIYLIPSDWNPALGEPFSFSAFFVRAPDGSIPKGGTVTFFADGRAVGSVPLDASGGARFTLPSGLRGAGPTALSASFNYPAGDLSGEAPTVTVNVSRAFAAIDLAASALSAAGFSAGAPVLLTSTVTVPTSIGVTPTGKVTFYSGSTVLGTVPLSTTGTAELTTTALPPGINTLRASYSGDGDVQGEMSAPLGVAVGRAVTTTALTAPTATVAPGQPVTLTATVAATGAFPVGSVEFLDGTTVLGTASVDGRGAARFTLNSLAPGPHTIVAVYGGSSMCGTSTSPPQTVTISGTPGAMATTTTLTTSAPAPVFGQDQTLTATVVTSAGPVTAGTVTFYDGQSVLGTASVDAHGTAALTARLNLGGHRLRAVYAGPAAFGPSSSAQLWETVAKAPTTVSLSLLANALGATVRPAFGGSPIGTVTFMDGTTVLGTAQVNGNGLAVLPLGKLSMGVHRLTAVYSGSSCFVGATSAAFNFGTAS